MRIIKRGISEGRPWARFRNRADKRILEMKIDLAQTDNNEELYERTPGKILDKK
jgi:hypothetical protein